MRTKNLYLTGMLAMLLCIVAGCTENSRARRFGGTMSVDLPPGQKLVNATWKENDLWYLTRPAESNDRPSVVTFQEKTSMGMPEGTVIFKESR